MKTNKEIRIKAIECGVYYWQIASVLGITPESFSRMMRKELEEEKKQEVLHAISVAAKRQGDKV